MTEASRETLRSLAHVDQESRTGKVAASRLRVELDYYFDKTTQGRAEKTRLDLPDAQYGSKKPYTLRPKSNRQNLSHVEHFWDAHCVGRPDREELQIIYTDPLFFWVPSQRCFVRFLDINVESDAPVDLAGKKKLLATAPHYYKPEEMVPSFHYKPSGEVAARDSVLRFLRRYDVIRRKKMNVTSRTTREIRYRDSLWVGNLVLLGNRRTNGLIRQLQDEHRSSISFEIMDHEIQYQRKKVYPNQPKLAYALVTRIPNRTAQGVVTFIGANHGRAAEKVAEFITNEKQMESFYGDLRVDRYSSLPETFQILFRVEIIDFDNPTKAHIEATTLGRTLLPKGTNPRKPKRFIGPSPL